MFAVVISKTSNTFSESAIFCSRLGENLSIIVGGVVSDFRLLLRVKPRRPFRLRLEDVRPDDGTERLDRAFFCVALAGVWKPPVRGGVVSGAGEGSSTRLLLVVRLPVGMAAGVWVAVFADSV